MDYKIVEFKGPETEWVVASSFDEAITFARDEIDDMADGLDAGIYVARELSADEVKELEIRTEDNPDKYEKATAYIENEINIGQVLPFHLMATYF